MDFVAGTIPISPDRRRVYDRTDKGVAARAKAERNRVMTEARIEMLRRAVRRYGKTAKGKATASRAREKAWLNRPFVAWDGEGVTRDDGSHDYLLLANSRGESMQSAEGLSTLAILDFLLTRAQKADINVIYGASYDFNMWLADFSADDLKLLYESGEISWKGYRIKWRRGKTFQISSGGESRIFYDVISFFQCSFVAACDSYLGADFIDREMIVQNKMLRSGFRPSDLDEIATYNRAELVNLVNLMVELRQRLYNAGLKPARWDGPGAIAVALMAREGVPAHTAETPDEVMPAIRSAYFGGRFEVIKTGHVPETAYEYDINSAYPWALQDVPSLAGGAWHLHDGDPGAQAYAIYHVTYRGATASTFPQPLPCRYETGVTAYPQNVEGWYWSPEIDVARRYVEMYGGTLTVHEAWVFAPASDVKPFAYVAPLFAERRALKAAGDGAHVGIKLGLNSQYGKLAQQVGWSYDRKKRELRTPPYHQLDWAGYVTSKTRAAVLDAALPTLEHVIAWETDAMFSRVPLDVVMGDGLGEWEATEFSSLTYLQSGMYFATLNGKEIAKTRGVDRGELTRVDILDALQHRDGTCEAKLTRFTTAGIALQSRFDHWRRWETTTKQMSLFPNGKRVHLGCAKCDGGFTLGTWHDTLLAPWSHGMHVSAEYEVEWQNPGTMSVLAQLRREQYEGMRYEDW